MYNTKTLNNEKEALIEYIISAQETVAESFNITGLKITSAYIDTIIEAYYNDEVLPGYEMDTLDEKNDAEIREIIQEFARIRKK